MITVANQANARPARAIAIKAARPTNLNQSNGGHTVHSGRAVHSLGYTKPTEPDDADGLAALTLFAWLMCTAIVSGLFAGIGYGIFLHLLK